jgi:chromate transport protein ChrA
VKERLRALKQRGGLQPQFRFGPALRGQPGDFRAVLPFRRSWKAIAVLLVFDAVFLLPAVGVFSEAFGAWSRFDSLFDLVIAVFMTAWLLGWSLAPLLMTTALLFMLFGREVVRAGPGRVEVHLGLPLLGVVMRYDPAAMCNLRLQIPAPKSGDGWRGPHLAFDYGANTFEMGSALDQAQVDSLRDALQGATLQQFRDGPALARELRVEKTPASIPLAVLDVPQAAVAEPLRWSSTSSLLLIAANLVPLVGAALWGWRLGEVMVLYWAESAVIGLFNLCKIAVIDRWLALGTGLFFLGHFSGFMAIHFLFLYTIFIEGPQASTDGGDLAQVGQMFRALWPALLALVISHGYSFAVNFMGRQEYRGRSTGQQMKEPYGRIMFMHLVLIFGGGLVMLLGDPTPVLLAVIVLKIVFDLRAHLRQHVRAE